MKIALVHELLTMRGGAEKVLRILADMFPSAPIYTLLYDEKTLGDWFPRERVTVSNIQTSKLFRFNSQFPFNHHLYLRLFPRAVEAWDFSEYDLVISTSSAFVHGIITNGKPKHLCIVNSPARYLWDRTHDVLEQANKGMFGWFKKKYLERTFHTLRIWDSETADRPDILLSASKIVQRRVELYWRRSSEVVYPPIDDCWLTPHPQPLSRGGRGALSYLIVSTLVPYKRIDLAIEACNALRRPLTIVGDGPDKKRLQKLAGPTITFAGYTPADKLRSYYESASAVIFPGDEDFGLVPLEAMVCGTPVIAFRSGGALETIIEGETGEFFDEPISTSLQDALKKFELKKYSKEKLLAQAKMFSKSEFERKIKEAISVIMK